MEGNTFLCICGNFDGLIDDLISIGVDGYNPPAGSHGCGCADPAILRPIRFLCRAIHPEKLSYGSVEDVRAETRRLLDLGREGYIIELTYDVECDVSLGNMLSLLDLILGQPGYKNNLEG